MGEEIRTFALRNPVSAGTHLVWCLWAMYVTALLWRLCRGDRLRRWSVGCFGLSMVLLYGASGAYHAIPSHAPILISYLRKLDHSAIYVLIAGTYTPMFAVLLGGRRRLALLSLVWALAAAGIASKWLLPWPPYWLTVGLYVGMGWVGVFAVQPLVRAVGLRGMGLAMVGGLLYTAGGICDAVQWPVLYPGVVGSHEVLHVLDMGGTFTHVVFVFRYILPFRGWEALPPA
jgi:hemolysin III